MRDHPLQCQCPGSGIIFHELSTSGCVDDNQVMDILNDAFPNVALDMEEEVLSLTLISTINC